MGVIFPLLFQVKEGRIFQNGASHLEDTNDFSEIFSALRLEDKTAPSTELFKHPQYGDLIISVWPESGFHRVVVQAIDLLKPVPGNLPEAAEMQRVLESFLGILDDVLIADGQGVILYISPSFEETYGVKTPEVIGSTVFAMEKKGVFSPSATAMVLERKEKVTIIQSTGQNRRIVVTAAPIFAQDGSVSKVISYSRDITELETLKARYRELEEQMERYSAELDHLRQDLLNVEGLIVKSEAMKRVIRTVQKIAAVDANVLITGETGVGKSLIAKLIHQKSGRSRASFIEINCAAIPENLLESELFGYESGSFTGAKKEGKLGLIELAHGGTLFLDEIGDLSLNLQVKLLQAIQEKKLTRLGGSQSVQVDFRLIAATNQNLEEMVQNGRFRRDLFYRLNVLPVYIPSLKERREDLLPLIDYFLQRANQKYGVSKVATGESLEGLLQYSWPGNVRELENVIEYLVVTTEGDYLVSADLPKKFQTAGQDYSQSLGTILERLERQLVREAYRKYGTTVKVAQVLGISQPTAARKIKKYCE